MSYVPVSNAGRGRSAFWGDCPIWGPTIDENLVFGFFDDFTQYATITAPTTQAALVGSLWSGFSEDASQIVVAEGAGGLIQLKQTTDNHGTSLRSLSMCFKISDESKPLWFETRLAPSHTATTEQGLLVGLMDSTACADDVPLLAAASALAAVNCIGFYKLDTDLTSIKTFYKANDVAVADVETCTSALEADTYVKLGFKFGSDKILRWYIDGVEQATTYTVGDALGTTGPFDSYMAPVIAMHLGAAASNNTVTIDWVGCYQLI